MKKTISKFAVVATLAFITSNTMAATTGFNENALCDLFEAMGGIFRMLRTLAFVGAGFIIAGWAWGYISAGKVEFKDVQGKGLGMLVGFAILFAIGTILTAFMKMAGPNGSWNCDIGGMW